MASVSYVLGAVAALVKSGGISPDYADGVRSVLEKQAFVKLLPVLARTAVAARRAGSAGGAAAAAGRSGVFRRLAGLVRRHPVLCAAGTAYATQKYRDAGQYARFNNLLRERNLERGGSNGDDGKPVDIRLTREDEVDAFDSARPWHDNFLPRLWNNTWHRWIRPMASALPGNPKTWDHYRIDYENRVRADEQDYVSRSNLESRAQGPLGQWAMADIHKRHSDTFNDYATGAKEWMDQAKREELGLPDKPVEMYQTPFTRSAIDSGLYKLNPNFGFVPPNPPTGYGGVSEYGAASPYVRSDAKKIIPWRD